MSSNFIEINNCTNISIEYNQINDICWEGIILSHSTNISIIENIIDTFCGMTYGISLSYVNYSYVINNIVCFTGGYLKIGLYRSHNNLIMNNSLLSTGGSGMQLYNSPYNNISHNTIKDCHSGIEVYYNSTFNQISSNHITVRYDAIDLRESNLNLIFNNSIDDSTIFKNDQGWLGIRVNFSNNNTILSNYIANLKGGISLLCSNFSRIINNTLFHNGNCISEAYSVGTIFINNLCIPISTSQPQISSYLVFLIIIISFLGLLFYLKKTSKQVTIK
jgi:parallel beta-helix repeat protein